MIPNHPTLADIREAAERIRPYIHRTPVLTCSSFNRLVNAEVFLKCENLQKTGAFKFRGACNTIFLLPDSQAARGVVTSSSGNHAQGVALSARLRGIEAYIAMPETAPEVKKAAVAGYGGKLNLCEWSLEALDATAERVARETGATFIHPFNLYTSICGHGTAALELLEDVADLDIIMAPVGGGGLLSGMAIAAAGLSPGTRVIGAEPEEADDAYQSLKEGRIMPARPPTTIADGLRTSLGDLTFSIIRTHVSEIVTVSEEGIVAAMRYIWERAKIIIEPSAAVPVAALMEKKLPLTGQRVGVILSGGNADLDKLPWAN
jgi:threonine dehydratase